MDEECLNASTKTEIGKDIKTESSDTNASSTDSINETSKPSNNNNDTPISKNGNGEEKNGQKRIKTEPIEGTSKKPRISTPEVLSIDIEAGGDNMDLNIKVEEVKVENKAGGDIAQPNEIKGSGDLQALEKKQEDMSSDEEEYYLTVTNLPKEWTYVQIKNYLDKECGHVDEMEMLKRRGKSKNYSVRLTFQTMEKCVEAFKSLENKAADGNVLKLKIRGTLPKGALPDSQRPKEPEIIPVRVWRPDEDSWDEDPEGLYGLRPQFLKALGITPPLNKTVHVSNFRCDKNELKEVMEMAGTVLMCSVMSTTHKYAKVMYSHPLEAVQAISMLNGQMYYGVPLKISMDPKVSKDCIILPKGLATIGQGLGLQAKPLRSIVHEYQKYVNQRKSEINPVVFSVIDTETNKFKTDENPVQVVDNINKFIKLRPGCNVLNPSVIKNIDELPNPDANPTNGNGNKTTEAQNVSNTPIKKPNIGPISPLNKNITENLPKAPVIGPPVSVPSPSNPLVRLDVPRARGFVPPNMMNPIPMRNPIPRPEPFARPINRPEPPRPFRPRVPFMPPMQRPPFAQPIPPPFRPPPGPIGTRPPIPPANVIGPRANLTGSVTVKFSNLPPSTTFPLLCDQLATCGQVMSVQLTTPGCAVATFGHPSHAERCYQHFNGMNVEGYVIAVNFM